MIAKLRVFAAAILCALMMAPAPSHAACAALSVCACTTTATEVAFGSYNPVAAGDTDSTGTIRVQCLLAVAIAGSFTIDLSTGNSGGYSQRALKQGTTVLNYNLYTNSARSKIFGDGSGGSSRINQSFSALLVLDMSFTVYARIPAGQNVATGPYGDSITVTVTY